MSIELKHEQREQQELNKRLAFFEKCINTPFIPGELSRWTDAVVNSFHELTDHLDRQRKQVHSDEFREIARQDPGLLQRVDQMRAEDESLASEQEQLAERIDGLRPAVDAVGADEAAMREKLNRLVADAQQFIARVRQQEVTVRTWFMEAFTRDRGVAD